MDEKELRRLKRSDLLQIVYYLKKKNEELICEIKELREKNSTVAVDITDDAINKIAEAVKEKMDQEK